MGCFFVNLPLRYIADEPRYVRFFLEHGLHPELGMDVRSLDTLPRKWHCELAEKLSLHNLNCTLHLPFFDLQPGSLDPFILEGSRKRLAMAVEIAQIYQPSGLIAHIGYDPVLYKEFTGQWRETACETWKMLLRMWPDHPPLFLENVRETDPSVISEFFRDLDSKKAGFCFDVGHWYSFGQGKTSQNLEEWMELLGPFIGHLHLHDNDGSHDQHVAMGRGEIDWERFFSLLRIQKTTPGITLEPHSEEDLVQTLAFLQSNTDMLQGLGFTQKDFILKD